MANPTIQWFCDTCHQLILSPRDGYVEWLVTVETPGTPRAAKGLRIVHHQPASQMSGGCQYRESRLGRDQVLADGSLQDYVGDDGLMLALSFSDWHLPQVEIEEFIKRLFVPGYERARFHTSAAINEGVIESNLPPGYFWASDIDTVLKWADETGRTP